jgi:hypothetical protein
VAVVFLSIYSSRYIIYRQVKTFFFTLFFSITQAREAEEQYAALRAAQESQAACRAEEEGGELQAIPDAVSNRMLNRVLVFAGIPATVGLLFFPFFYYLKTQLEVDVPVWVVYIFSATSFTAALGGESKRYSISYLYSFEGVLYTEEQEKMIHVCREDAERGRCCARVVRLHLLYHVLYPLFPLL